MKKVSVIVHLHLIADNGKEFLKKAHNWKEYLKPCTEIEILELLEIAKRKYVLSS